MAIASNIYLVTVTGEYVDYEGTPIAGQIIFRVPKTLRNALEDQILIPSAFVATLDAQGSFSAVLPASDDPEFHEQFEYTITESFVGGRTFQAVLPEGTASLDMTDIVPVFTGPTFVTLAAGSQYPFLEARVVVLEGQVQTTAPTGIILTLEYASVPVSFATYGDLVSGPADYAALAVSSIVATSAAIAGFLSAAEAAQAAAEAEQAAAEQSILDVELVGARFPDPFVFVGVG